MKNGFWSKVRRFAALGCVALSVAGASYAQEPLPQTPAKDPIAEMNARLDRLEKENAELRQIIKGQSLISHNTPGTVMGAEQDKASVEKIVADYMKAEAKKAKDAEDKKNKENEDKGVGYGDLSMTARWNNGLDFSTKDRAFRFHIGGRVHQDVGFFDVDQNIQSTGPGLIVPDLSVGDVRDAANFRRLRLRADGTMWEVVEWVAEIDFANGVTAPTDVYARITQLPLIGNLQAGHFKEPFSLEQLTSSRYLTFMERSLINQPFVPAFNQGIMIQRTFAEESVWAALGIFRTNTDNITGLDQGDGEYSVTGRLAASPVYENNGRCLVHLGIAASHRNLEELNSPASSTVTFSTQPEVRIGFPTWATTGAIAANHVQLVGLEAAVQNGSWNMQAEYVAARVDRFFAVPTPTDPGNPTFHGFYIQTSYFLTGEHRPYRRSSAAFDRVIPHESFFLVGTGEDGHCGTCCGKGAWEIALRFSQLDLDDSGIDGGNVRDVTFGVNWYLNPNFKIQANYIFSHRDVRAASVGGVLDSSRFDGDAHIFAMRLAFDF
jgi:phosphate-selective porin OprO and OprP